MVSKEKMNPVAPDSLKGRAPGVEPGNEQGGVPQGSNIQRGSANLQRDTAGVGERGGVASQQTDRLLQGVDRLGAWLRL